MKNRIKMKTVYIIKIKIKKTPKIMPCFNREFRVKVCLHSHDEDCRKFTQKLFFI